VEELLYHYVQPVGGGAELRVMKPDDCPEGSVGRIWDYGMMLPAFLRAIAMRLVVLQAKSPEDYVTGFVHVWDDRLNIRAYATKLWEIHNRIRDNIKVIPRPELWGELTYKALIASGTLPSRWCLRSEVTYGAVECYSGTPKVDVYALNDRPAVPAEQATDAEWQAYYDQCMAYYQLFSWRYDSYSYVRQVQLYHELILPALWNTINSLRALTLDPPLEATEYAREPWFRYLTAFSLRQFFSFLPESMRAGWMAGQPLSLRALLAATGITGQGEPISLRRAFGLDS
jgi:hypothetical protein